MNATHLTHTQWQEELDRCRGINFDNPGREFAYSTSAFVWYLHAQGNTARERGYEGIAESFHQLGRTIDEMRS